MTSPENCLFHSGILSSNSTVLELGCGISGVMALMMAPMIAKYLATDQDYVLKTLKRNIQENTASCSRKGRSSKITSDASMETKISILELDWELSSLGFLSSLLGSGNQVDAIIGCDCIYNEVLVGPFVRVCAEICRINQMDGSSKPTICLIAQQLRSPDIFDIWLQAFHSQFRVWAIPDHLLSDSLKSNTGYALHLGILR